MIKRKFFGFFMDYLRAKHKTVIMLVFFFVCFFTVFKLYGIPVTAVSYAALLCFAGAFIFAVIDAVCYYLKYKKLCELKSTVTVCIKNLPAPKDAVETLYQELLIIVDEDKRDISFRADCTRSELIDYFTLWAHQIKTPIAAMRLILQTRDSADAAELRTELNNIEQYVEMVLGYLRLDSEYSDYVIGSLDLDGIIRSAIRKFAPSFIRKKIRLNYTPPELTVVSDEKWLLFVIEQIISNALKYTKEGSISIYAEGTTLIIEDTGIGIAEEDLPRVFDKGFTGYNGRENKQSTGIGLYLTKKILSRLGHGITIESEAGKGTRVMLDLKSEEIRHE